MQYLYRATITIVTLILLLTHSLITSDAQAQERPASIVLKEVFGSDPYKMMAQKEDIIVVTGLNKAASSSSNGRHIDILQYSDSAFTALGQYEFSQSTSGQEIFGVIDLASVDEHWIFLLRGLDNDYLVSADVSGGEVTILNELRLSALSSDAIFLQGENNNLYIVDANINVVINHISVGENAELTLIDTVSLGTSVNDALFSSISASYDNQNLYVISNQTDSPAVFYQVALNEDGQLQPAQTLNFENAESEYSVSQVSGNLWMMSYPYWGFQVAEINNDRLTIIYDFDQDSQYSAIKINQNYLYGIDVYGEIDVFEVSTDNTVDYLNSVRTKGFLRDAVIANNSLIVTRDWNGIESFDISSETLSSQAEFNQSGEVSDFSIQNQELAVSAFESNLHFWNLDKAEKASLDHNFTTLNSIMGVEFANDKILIGNSGFLELHQVTNVKNNINIGEQIGALNSSGTDGQIITLDNGYLAQAFLGLEFFDLNFEKQSSFVLGDLSNQFHDIQEISTLGHLVFVPILSASQVVIYDVSDITNVVELSRITRPLPMLGNVVASGDYLYVPLATNDGAQAIQIYNISDPENPLETSTISIPNASSNVASLHIDDEFLLAINKTASLFDITNPELPELIEQRDDISTNGIAMGDNEYVYSVKRSSAGVIMRTQINLAPRHPNVEVSTSEDTPITVSLDPVDKESDLLSYQISSSSSKGSLIVVNDTELLYSPSADENGDDMAVVLVSDEHGGATEFNVNISITAVNDAPVLESSTINVLEDEQVIAVLTGSDVDSSNLSFTLTANGENGTATLSSDGELSYQANPNFFGTDSIEVTLSDDEGATDAQSIQINVEAVNDVPVFVGETEWTGEEDTDLTISLEANDVEGDVVEFGVADLPEAWNGSMEGNSLTISPQANANGTFTITVTMNDGSEENTQTLTIVLSAVNDAPEFENESVSLSLTSGQSRSTSLSASDVDGDTLSYEIVESSSLGTATINNQGQLTFTAGASATGSDTITVRVSDSSGAQDTISVSVNISAPPAPSSPTGSSGGGSMHWLYLFALVLIARARRNIRF